MIRVKTGIPGFDELVEGGFPESSSVLVAGGPGCGKSIFCLEYLYNGAKLYGEPGVYITLEEGPHTLWWNMQRFKWDLLPLERENKLKIYKFEPSEDMAHDLENQTKRIVDKARELGAKRMVIDSITAFSFWLEDAAKIRYAMYLLIEELRKINCTTILTAETTGGKAAMSRYGVEEFLTDGVVQLFFMPPNRGAFVRKMRGTNHSKSVHPMSIADTGLGINPREEILWEAIKD
ncbi:MAG TPA: ATPase domain-containing protein [Candidatus Norongarragalinales archaeon]|jgi:KaiC/GvpD/RAD55 family RecA-like ATPase|nr:ATPase domain-containing protein [Candidatus Norongarragalinales archaeon]